jgi:hypothetical protein
MHQIELLLMSGSGIVCVIIDSIWIFPPYTSRRFSARRCERARISVPSRRDRDQLERARRYLCAAGATPMMIDWPQRDERLQLGA